MLPVCLCVSAHVSCFLIWTIDQKLHRGFFFFIWYAETPNFIVHPE